MDDMRYPAINQAESAVLVRYLWVQMKAPKLPASR